MLSFPQLAESISLFYHDALERELSFDLKHTFLSQCAQSCRW